VSESPIARKCKGILPDYLIELMEAAVQGKKAAQFRAVGIEFVEWALREDDLPRDVTSHSASEPVVHKEELPETRVWNHTPFDHFGEPHGSLACLHVEHDGVPELGADPDDDDL